MESAQHGRYVVGEQIGKGGMGTLHRAQDRVLDRVVGYKRLLVTRESLRASMTALFRREYEVMLSLEHPCTVQAFDFGLDAHGPFYTMELLSGADLGRLEPLPWREACAVLRDVASALALLHARGLVHRDVSPNNVRVLADGSAKLLDYGALAPFGPPRDVIGTPAFMSPECARGLPLDARADLFSLGALAYWALTHRASFPARSLDALEDAWEIPVPAPSTLSAEIPVELDELILQLLKLDRSSRPDSAAHVIERLTAIAQLPPERGVDAVARSFLARPPLAERDDALLRIRHALREAREGRGGAVLLEAGAGLGRSALLERVATEAQLADMTVLRSAGTHAVPFALLRELLQGAEPSDVSRDASAASPADVAERRAATADQLEQELLALRAPTLICVDDVQLADADSIRVLSSVVDAFARQSVLMILSVEASAPLEPELRAALEARAQRVVLEPLTEAGVAQLAAHVLGNVPNARRAASALYEASGGSPGVIVDLLRTLLSQGDIAYAGGTFTVPQRLDLARIPRRGLRLARLAGLDADTYRLASLLALATEPLSRASLQHATGLSERDITLALATLGRRGLANAVQDGAYVLPSPLIRAQLDDQLDEATRSTLHAAIARAMLAASPADWRTRIVAGTHIIRSGDDVLRGAHLIAEACHGARFEIASLSALTPSLEAALLVYHRQQRPESEALRLLIPLALSGYYGDLEAQGRHLDRALGILSRNTGLVWAPALARWLGTRLALYVSLLLGFVRGVITRPGSARSFRDDLQALFSVVANAVAAHVSAFDARAAMRAVAWLEPFSASPTTTGPGVAREVALSMVDIACARPTHAHRRHDRIDAAIAHGVRAIDARVVTLLSQGVLNGRAQNGALRSDPRTLEHASALRATGAIFAPHSHVALVGYYGMRGEEALAETHRARAEELALRGGLSWAAHSVLCFWLAQCNAATDDAVGLVHVIAALEPLRTKSPGLGMLHALAVANLARVRGKHEEALERFQAVFASGATGMLPSYALERAYQAECLLSLGRDAEAAELCREALRTMEDDDPRGTPRRALSQQLALAMASAGKYDEARAALTHWLGLETDVQNPLALGSLHHDLALVAILEADPQAFRTHAASAETYYRSTHNVSLLARHERLLARARRAGLLAANAAAHDSLDEVDETYIEPLSRDPRAPKAAGD